MGAQAGSWGVDISGIDLQRFNGHGEESFRLIVNEPLHVHVGENGVSRLPVMGPSGAGKSTLMNLLSCTSLPQGSQAKVSWRFPDGHELEWGARGLSASELVALRQTYFGYAHQSASLQPQLTMGENLTFSLENLGVSRSKARDLAVESLCRAFDGDEERAKNIMTRFNYEVSGGERQRVSLLQALMRDPCVLFADEPTGSLDQNTRRTVMSILTDWLDDKPDERLLIWVTHHDRDPQDNDAHQRLYVADGGVRIEQEADGVWSRIEKLG